MCHESGTAVAMLLRRRPAYLLLALACSASAACASVSDSCRKDASDCIRRCEATTDERGVQNELLQPENTMSYCESKCGCRKTSSPPPKSSGKPTPTGNAPATP